MTEAQQADLQDDHSQSADYFDEPPRLRRLGRFRIEWSILERYPDAAVGVLAGLIIWRVEMLYAWDAVEYLAEGQPFEPVMFGSEVPTYRPIFTQHTAEDGSTTITWEWRLTWTCSKTTPSKNCKSSGSASSAGRL